MGVINIDAEINKIEREIKEKQSILNYLKSLEPLDSIIVFSDKEKELIVDLWDKGRVGFREQLVTRDRLSTCKDNSGLTRLYSKLLSKHYIYKKVAYFSNIEWWNLVEQENIKITSKN